MCVKSSILMLSRTQSLRRAQIRLALSVEAAQLLPALVARLAALGRQSEAGSIRHACTGLTRIVAQVRWLASLRRRRLAFGEGAEVADEVHRLHPEAHRHELLLPDWGTLPICGLYMFWGALCWCKGVREWHLSHKLLGHSTVRHWSALHARRHLHRRHHAGLSALRHPLRLRLATRVLVRSAP